MDWGRIVELVVRTPEKYYCPISGMRAAKILNCSAADIDALAEVYGATKGKRFDVFDVWNMGLVSGSGRSEPERDVHYLGHLYERTDWLEPAQYKIGIDASCPRGTKCTSTDWRRPSIPDVKWGSATVGTGTIRWSATVYRRGTRGDVRDPAIRDTWQLALAQLRFHYTHPAIAASGAVTRQRQVGNCTGLSVALAQLLTEAGIHARTMAGFLWGGVLGQAHEWVEAMDVDGTWKVLDPSMAALADDFFTPEYKQFCCGSMLNRIIPMAQGKATTVLHNCAGETYTSYPVMRRASTRPVVAGSARPGGSYVDSLLR